MELDSDPEPEPEPDVKEDMKAFDINAMYFNKLSEEKQKEARAKGLCFYCLQTGHMANKCPKRPARPANLRGKAPRRFQGNKRRFKPRINEMEVEDEDYDEPNNLEDQAYQINEIVTNLAPEDRFELFNMLDRIDNKNGQDFDEEGNYDGGNF